MAQILADIFYIIVKKNRLMNILQDLNQLFTEAALMMLLHFSKGHVLFERT